MRSLSRELINFHPKPRLLGKFSKMWRTLMESEDIICLKPHNPNSYENKKVSFSIFWHFCKLSFHSTLIFCHRWFADKVTVFHSFQAFFNVYRQNSLKYGSCSNLTLSVQQLVIFNEIKHKTERDKIQYIVYLESAVIRFGGD